MSQRPIASSDEIVATGGTYYRRMRYLVALILVAAGAWFAYDGWVGYPAMNVKHAEKTAELKDAESNGNKKLQAELVEQLKDLHFKTDTDIGVQKGLAIGLPLLGAALLTWALYNSRGEIRLTSDTLTAPGHPPVKTDQIMALDKRLWDRKDIAFVDYEVGAAKGRIRLDAFVYQTDPIVKIYDRIEAIMKEEAGASPQ